MDYTENQSGFYYIEIRAKAPYKTFRVFAVGDKSGIERVAGQRADGSWETVKWLVSKELAHVENGKLVAESPEAIELFDKFYSAPEQIEGNLFKAKDKRTSASQNRSSKRFGARKVCSRYESPN